MFFKYFINNTIFKNILKIILFIFEKIYYSLDLLYETKSKYLKLIRISNYFHILIFEIFFIPYYKYNNLYNSILFIIINHNNFYRYIEKS